MKSFYTVELAMSGGVYRDESLAFGSLTELQRLLELEFWFDLREGASCVLGYADIPLQTIVAGHLVQEINLWPFITVHGPNGVTFTFPKEGDWYTLDSELRDVIAGTDIVVDEEFRRASMLSLNWGAVPLLPLEEPLLKEGEEAEYEEEYDGRMYTGKRSYGYHNNEGDEESDAEYVAMLEEALWLDPAWLSHNYDAARGLAEAMHRTGDYSAMPVLADALQEAGCENELILWHCRSPAGVHARGSWLVERIRRG